MGRETAGFEGESLIEAGASRAGTVSLSCARNFGPVTNSPRAEQVQRSFGLASGRQSLAIASGAAVRLGPGRVILLTGPSGSGESSVLAAIAGQCDPANPNRTGNQTGRMVSVQDIRFRDDCAIIDQIAPNGPFADAAAILTACGLGEAGLWLRPYVALSEGERFRARLARMISLQAGAAGRNEKGDRGATGCSVLLCDEFCAGLHRRAARAIAFNLRKLATRRGLCFVLATSADDLTFDLDPDTIVRFSSGGSCEVSERTPLKKGVPSIRRELRIEPGCKRDYEAFAGMHYRATDELGFVDRVFVLRQVDGAEPLGIVVYAHPALELSLRNKATRGWFSRNPTRVNRHLRVLRRLVIHPDVRGCGLGHFLVRKTMPLIGTRFVECLAAMGEFNPVFERGGMTRVGQYDVPSGPRTAVEALKLMDIDPHSPELALHVARRPGVRAVIANAVADWYAATTVGGERRVERQSPEFLVRAFRGLIGVRPVYYLWRSGQRTSRMAWRGRLRSSGPRRIL